MTDFIDITTEVTNPTSKGCYPWMSIRAGAPSKFCNRVDFFAPIYDKDGNEITGGGGGGVDKYVDLTDVSFTPDATNDGVASHYNHTTGLFEAVPEMKVNPTSREITFQSTDAFSALAQGVAVMQSLGSDATVDAQANVNILSNTGKVDVDALGGDVEVGGQNISLESTAPTGKVTVVPQSGASSYGVIATTNKTAQQYATDISTVDEAIPNKIYVDNKVLPKAPANGIYSNRYEWTTSITPTAGQITSLTLSPDTYADLTTATHIRIHESDLNGARWFWPFFVGAGTELNWQCSRVPVNETPLTAIEGIGFVFPDGHTVVGPVSGYYTINITGGFQTAPPANGNQYNIELGPYSVFLESIRGKVFNNLPYACVQNNIGIGYDIATLAGTPVEVPLTDALADIGNDQIQINTPSNGEITWDPTVDTQMIVKVTLDARVYSTNVQDERILVIVEHNNGGGYFPIGLEALSYSSNSLSIAQRQGTATRNIAVSKGDRFRISLIAGDGATAPAQPSTFLINVEDIVLNINVIKVS